MKRVLPQLFDTLFALALALWLGGQGTFLLFILSGGADHAHHAPRLFVHHFQLLIEVCGLLLVGVLFLLRRRYQRNRSLFLGDGVRQLLTFAALMLAEYAKYGLRSGLAAGADPIALTGSDFILTVTQIVLLLAVTALTVWLQRPQMLPAPAAAAAPASPAPKPPQPKPSRAVSTRRSTK